MTPEFREFVLTGLLIISLAANAWFSWRLASARRRTKQLEDAYQGLASH